MPKQRIKRKYYPGEIVENSGQVNLRGSRGGKTGRQATVVEGERIPPTPKKGMYYYLTDLTVHKR